MAKFRRGAKFVVQSLVGSDSDLLRRLVTLGLVSGTCLEVTNVAPLGDPIEFKARGYSLSLRATEADVLNLKSLDSAITPLINPAPVNSVIK